MPSDLDVNGMRNGSTTVRDAVGTEVAGGATNGHEPLPARAVLEPSADPVAALDVHGTIVPLEERKRRILGAIDQAALSVGAELILAKAEHRGEFMRWVETELPFGIDRAERLMAIARAFGGEAIVEHLPSAWTAMFELTKVPPAALMRGVDNGTVSPGMTVEAARRYVATQREHERNGGQRRPATSVAPSLADAHATALLRYGPDDLSEEIRWKMHHWLSTGSTSTGSATSSPET